MKTLSRIIVLSAACFAISCEAGTPSFTGVHIGDGASLSNVLHPGNPISLGAFSNSTNANNGALQLSNAVTGNIPVSVFTNDTVQLTLANLPAQTGGGVFNVAQQNAFANDTTCLPCLHISNAVIAAHQAFVNTGTRQTVLVYPGVYHERNLLWQGVDIKGMSSAAEIQFTEPTTNEMGYGILDDRFLGGPTTNYIDWPGKMTWEGFTNVVSVIPTNTTGTISATINTNSFGCIVLTNPLSKLRGHIGKAQASGYFEAQPPSCFYIQQNNGSIISVDEMDDPDAGTTNNWFNVSKGALTVHHQINQGNNGVYWGAGDLYMQCPRIVAGQYSLWPNEPGGGPLTNSFYFYGDYINGKIYTVGLDLSYKGWFYFNQLECTNPGSIACIEQNGGGKWYYTGQKINMLPSAGSYCYEAYPNVGVVSNANTWLNIEKMTGPAWMNDHAGITWVTSATHFEDDGGVVVGGINVFDNAQLYINGGVANATGSIMNFGIQGNPTCHINGLLMYSTNNATIICETNGLTLQNCTMVAGSNTNTIYAPVPVTVAVYNCVGNSNQNANVTLSPSNNFFVNGNVK